MTPEQSEDNYGKRIWKKLVDYRPIRHQRYAAVTALLISWTDDDTNSADEIRELKRVFRECFGYTVCSYLIPSINSQASLNYQLASFVHAFGGPDSLLLVYYGGHGGPRVEKDKSPCTWAARIEVDSPSLDWSLIQPSLLNADCDIAIILDCCYAGQAARSVSAQTIELLAATDKDQFTLNSASGWQTFTQALTKAMESMIKTDKVVTLRGLAKSLSQAEARLYRQPFHISLGRDNLAGPIKLAKLRAPEDLPARRTGIDSTVSLQLQLSLFEPLSLETASSLIRWMTRDSPTSIEDIQFTEDTFAEAKDTSQIYDQFLGDHSQPDSQFLPYLSEQGQAEGLTLLSHLRGALSSPTSTSLTNSQAMEIVSLVKQRSRDLVVFIEDSLPRLNAKSLLAFNAGDNQDLKTRINMRLTLIAENMPEQETAIAFDVTDPPREGQRFRMGWKDGKRVIVEYFYYEETKNKSDGSILQQVRRISALHTESKDDGFHLMLGCGFLRELFHVRRYGIIYQIPAEKTHMVFSCLSELMSRIKSVPLEVRIRTAYALCEALVNLHSIGWYHKAVKSESVLYFGRKLELAGKASFDQWDLNCPYLVGFNCSRPSAVETYSTVDFTIGNNIYRHPDRWGHTTSFQRHHDIYAMGILLLEIGCWRLLKDMDSKGQDFQYIKDPEDLRMMMLGSILDRAAHAVGTKFASTIRFCLEKRRWSDLEEWEIQKLIRHKVLEPLKACYSQEVPDGARG